MRSKEILAQIEAGNGPGKCALCLMRVGFGQRCATYATGINRERLNALAWRFGISPHLKRTKRSPRMKGLTIGSFIKELRRKESDNCEVNRLLLSSWLREWIGVVAWDEINHWSTHKLVYAWKARRRYWKNQEEYRLKRLKSKKQQSLRRCDYCKNTFIPNRATGRFCSTRCREGEKWLFRSIRRGTSLDRNDIPPVLADTWRDLTKLRSAAQRKKKQCQSRT